MDQQIMEFLKTVLKDKDFVEKTKALKTREDFEGYIKDKGFTFSFDELSEALAAINNSKAKDQ